MKTLFSYFQQFSLPKVRQTRLQADFVTNNQILVVKIIKSDTTSYSGPHLISPHLLDFVNTSCHYKDKEGIYSYIWDLGEIWLSANFYEISLHFCIIFGQK